ncbi:MAG: PIN domain-containing protein [Pseudomonas sp.]
MKTRKEVAWGGLREGALIVVDSAPLIYVLERHPRLASRFIGLFEAQAEGRLRIAVSTIALAEVLAGPFRHGLETLASQYEHSLLERFEVVPVSAGIAVAASRLRIRYGLKLPDAIHLATVLDIGADALVTHDRDFGKVEGLRILRGEVGASAGVAEKTNG